MKLLKEDRKVLYTVFLAIILFYLIAFRGVIFQSGHVYQNWDNGMPPFSIQLRHLAEFSKTTWWSNLDMGTPGVWGGITRYFDFIILNRLSFLGGKFLSKFLYLIYALIGGIGFWAVCRSLGWGLFTTVIVVLLSQFNPKTYSLAVSGHLLQQGFAYSLIPWFLLILHRGLNKSSAAGIIINTIYAGLIGVFICSTSPIVIAWFIITYILFLVAAGINKIQRQVLIAIFIIPIIIIMFHLFWLVPAGIISKDVEASYKYSRTPEESLNEFLNAYHTFSPRIFNSIIGHTHINDMGREYVYPVISGKIKWLWKSSAYILFLLAFSGSFFRSRWRSWKLFSLLSLFTGIILYAGDKTIIGRVFYEEILIRLKIIFFLMSRTSRWLAIYYIGFALMLGFGLDGLNYLRQKSHWPFGNRLIQVFLTCIFIIYWFPYLSGSITKPKNNTSQTLSLMPQEVSEEEIKAAKQFSEDKEDYRITVLPTVAGPTGYNPAPPKSTYTRNFALFGRDTIIGPQYVGELFSRILLNLLHRESPYTDQFGRLLAMGAVKYVLKVKDEKYYSFFDYGYMPQPNGCHETLYDPHDVLERFLLKQKNLIYRNEPIWNFQQVDIYNNADFVPRIRMAMNAYLVSGGMPLFISLANLQTDYFAKNALFFGTDMDELSLKRLQLYWKGIIIYNNLWTELVIPLLPKDYWYSAAHKADYISDEWFPLKDVWHKELWIAGSAINTSGQMSRGKAEMAFHLYGSGSHRLFICYGRRPYSNGINFYLNEKDIGSINDIEANNRGVMWNDFGDVELEPKDNIFKIVTLDKGIVIYGILCVPSEIFNTALGKMSETFLNNKKIFIISEAEAVSKRGAVVKRDNLVIPLLHDDNVKITLINAKNDQYDKEENRIIRSEGDQKAEVIFEAEFEEDVSKCRLECYPGIFNDIDGKNYIAAFFSNDGVNYSPIFRRTSNKNGKWDAIYAWRQEDVFNYNDSKIYIKFEIKSGRLSSFKSGSNMPMRLIGEVQGIDGAVKSFGQAVSLPAEFSLYIPSRGNYHVTARIIGIKGEKTKMAVSGLERTLELQKDGVEYLDMGNLELDEPGFINLDLQADKVVSCDLFEIESINGKTEKDDAINNPDYDRIDPARYVVKIDKSGPALLLFSEAFHPKWYLRYNNELQEPIKAYGFMNAYPIISAESNLAEIYFKYQPIREYFWRIATVGWMVICIFIVLYGGIILIRKLKKVIYGKKENRVL